jgi:hypothetical protein
VSNTVAASQRLRFDFMVNALPGIG